MSSVARVNLEPRRRSGCGSAYITLSDPPGESVLPVTPFLSFGGLTSRGRTFLSRNPVGYPIKLLSSIYSLTLVPKSIKQGN